MKTILKLVVYALTALMLVISPVAAEDDDIYRRLAIQVSDNDPGTFNKALNVAANFARATTENGYEPVIEIVAFNAGLHMLREDNSPVLERIASMSGSLPDIQFSACGNTIAGMTRNEGAAPPLSEHAVVVPGGVGRLMALDAQGYFVIRP